MRSRQTIVAFAAYIQRGTRVGRKPPVYRSREGDAISRVGGRKDRGQCRGSRSSARFDPRALFPRPSAVATETPRFRRSRTRILLDRARRGKIVRSDHTWLLLARARRVEPEITLRKSSLKFKDRSRHEAGFSPDDRPEKRLLYRGERLSRFPLPVFVYPRGERTATTATYPFAATADVGLPPAATIKGSYRRQDRTCSICGTSSTPIDRIIVNEHLAMINRRFYYRGAVTFLVRLQMNFRATPRLYPPGVLLLLWFDVRWFNMCHE